MAGRKNNKKKNKQPKLQAGRVAMNLVVSILIGLVFAGIFCTGVYVFAAYGTDATFPPGNTLNPGCVPGSSVYCTVTSPVPYTGATASVDIGSYNFTTTGSLGAGGVTGTSFIIGANTLDTNEWAYLDGQNQAIKTTSSPIFANLSDSGLTASVLIKTDANKQFIDAVAGVDYETPANKNQPNGYPGLDASGNLIGLFIPRTDTAANMASIVLEAGELATTSDTHVLLLGDGSTAGGIYFNGVFNYVNITDETNGYQVDGLRVITNKGTSGSENLFLGQSGNFTTTGANNIFAGYQAGNANTTGPNNNYIGYQAGYTSTTGSSDNFIGYQAGFSNTTGNSNDFFGHQAGYSNTTGSNNTAIGFGAGYTNSTGSSNVFLGNLAGKYETGSSAFYVDNQDRTNTAGDKAKALIYGQFATTAASQAITFNVGTASFGAGNISTTGTISSAGFQISGAAASGKILIGDGTSFVASTPTFPNVATTTGAYLRADGTNFIQSTLLLPNAGTVNKLAVYSAANTLGELAAVGSTGTLLTGVTGGLPVWTTATYPGITGATQVLYSPLANVVGGSGNMTFDGTSLTTTGFIGPLKVSSATGVNLTATTGVLTMTGLKSAGNNENLTFDFEGTSNAVAIGSGTGVATINWNALNLTTTGIGTFGYVNITAETNGYQVDGLRVITNKGASGSENLFLGTSGNSGTTGTNNIFAGNSAGANIGSGSGNNFIGYRAGNFVTTGGANNFIGFQAGYGNNLALGAGSNDNFIGYQAGYSNTVGDNNNFIGYQAGYSNTGGSSDNFIGYQAGRSNTTGSLNVAIGYQAGYTNVTGSNDVFLGPYAGKYETGSNAFYVDNQDRTNTAGDKATALIYGVFAATAANQSLTINAGTVNLPSIPAGTGNAGTVTIDSTTGKLYVTSSSLRFKHDVKLLANDWSKILQVQPKSFQYNQSNDPDVGYIAEDFAALGLTDLVLFDSQGRPNAIKYDRITLYDTEILKQHQLDIDEIKRVLGISTDNIVVNPAGTLGSGTVLGVADLTVKQSLLNLGATLTDGVMSLKQVLVDNLIAKTADIAQVNVQKIQIVDQLNGDVYCTWVAGGEWQKVKGDCASVQVAVAETITPPVQIEPEVQPIVPQTESVPQPEAQPLAPEVQQDIQNLQQTLDQLQQQTQNQQEQIQQQTQQDQVQQDQIRNQQNQDQQQESVINDLQQQQIDQTQIIQQQEQVQQQVQEQQNQIQELQQQIESQSPAALIKPIGDLLKKINPMNLIKPLENAGNWLKNLVTFF